VRIVAKDDDDSTCGGDMVAMGAAEEEMLLNAGARHRVNRKMPRCSMRVKQVRGRTSSAL
jgi:hypothetical protein